MKLYLSKKKIYFSLILVFISAIGVVFTFSYFKFQGEQSEIERKNTLGRESENILKRNSEIEGLYNSYKARESFVRFSVLYDTILASLYSGWTLNRLICESSCQAQFSSGFPELTHNIELIPSVLSNAGYHSDNIAISFSVQSSSATVTGIPLMNSRRQVKVPEFGHDREYVTTFLKSINDLIVIYFEHDAIIEYKKPVSMGKYIPTMNNIERVDFVIRGERGVAAELVSLLSEFSDVFTTKVIYENEIIEVSCYVLFSVSD